MKPIVLALVSCALLVAQEGQPPGKPAVEPRLVVRHDGDDLVLSTENGAVGLDELTRRWSETTGRNFTYSTQFGRGPALQLTGAVHMKKADADFVFESLLVRAGFALMVAGPAESKLFAVEPTESSRSLKQSAAFVPSGEVAGLERKPAQVFTTAFVLQSASAPFVRTAIQQLLSNRSAELATDLPSTNTLVVTAFGPTLVAVKNLVEAADRATPAPTPRFETIALKYAVADEVCAVVDALLRAKDGNPPKPAVRSQDGAEAWSGDKIETRIVADPRTNSVLVQGSESLVATVKRLIAVLDVPAEAKPK